MKVTIDKAGRLVIPKELRDQVGIGAGKVDIVVQGAGLRIDIEADERTFERDGWLLAGTPGTATDSALTDELIHELRVADQR